MQAYRKDTLNTPRAFEARAWELYYSGDWLQGLNQAIGWLGDESFSARPFALAAYLTGSMLGNHQQAIDITRVGLEANPKNPALINNLIFHLLEIGQTGEAVSHFDQLRGLEIEPQNRIALKATLGMSLFRTGKEQMGQKLYEDAISDAQHAGMTSLAARAAIHLAIEEARVGSENAEHSIVRAHALAERVTEPDVAVLLSRLDQPITA